jgi:oligosaccharide repeat unit polymerase
MLLFSPVFIMSRAAFLYILVPIVCAWYLSARYVRHVRLHVGRLLTVGAGVLCIFVSLACLFNHLRKGSAGGSFLFTYFCNPLLAFDAVVLRGDFHTAGGYVLYPLLRVASALRGRPMPDTDIGLVSTDFNVFTCMGGPYLDFGPTGMVLVFLLLGMAYGVLYAWVRRGHLFSTVFYAVVVSPLVMSFYTYAFGLLWIYYGALVLFLAIVAGIDGESPARRVTHA